MNLTLLWILLIVFSCFLQYWIIRLAVRGGIEDAGRRRLASLAEEELWRSINEKRDQGK